MSKPWFTEDEIAQAPQWIQSDMIKCNHVKEILSWSQQFLVIATICMVVSIIMALSNIRLSYGLAVWAIGMVAMLIGMHYLRAARRLNASIKVR